MKWRQTEHWLALWQGILFPVLRDIACLGMGMYMLSSQVGAPHPDWGVIVGGLTLALPAAVAHGSSVASRAREALSGPSAPGPGPGESAPPELPQSSSPPSPPAGGTREAR